MTTLRNRLAGRATMTAIFAAFGNASLPLINPSPFFHAFREMAHILLTTRPE
jgi:hypothetical protein